MSNKVSLYAFYLFALLAFLPAFLKNYAVDQAGSTLKSNADRIEQKIKEQQQKPCLYDRCYAAELNDRLWHYLEDSKYKGIPKILTKTKEIIPLIESGVLVQIEANEYYVLDTMYYSYPFLTPKAKQLLEEIGKNFQNKLRNTGLECTRFTITSMLRTTQSINRLRRWNRNSVKNSAHLHGTTFDISYRTFFGDQQISYAESLYLGDVLAKTIWELRLQNKCWATYETWQTCYHVVAK